MSDFSKTPDIGAINVSMCSVFAAAHLGWGTMLKMLGLGVLATSGLFLVAGQAHAQLESCQVGQRVAMPAGYGGKWLNAVVIEVNQASAPFICNVHPLGYTPYANAHHMPKQLRDPGSVTMEKIGGIVDDPYLLAAQGGQAYKATSVAAGHYDCAAFTDKHLVARPSLEFTILDGRGYQDAFGAKGTYAFDAGSGSLVFHGAALDGQRGIYKQASNPPVKTQPPEFNFDVSHDGCTLDMR